MKKFTFAVSAVVSATLIASSAQAGIYISGSFSPLMETSFSVKNKASIDPTYYLIDCSVQEYVDMGFCDALNGDLSWIATDDQTLKVTTDAGMAFGGAVGYYHRKYPVRFELEYTNISNDVKKGEYKIIHGSSLSNLPYDFTGDKLSLNSIMANAYYGINLGIVRPYIGVGLGYIGGEAEFIHKDKPIDIEYGLGLQFMGGVEFPIGRTGLYIGAEYRYIDLGMLDVKDTYLNESSALDKGNVTGLLFKVRYAFSEYSKQTPTSKRRPIAPATRSKQQNRGRQRQGQSYYESEYYGEQNYNTKRSYY